LNDDNVVDNITSGGGLFHFLAAAVENAQLPVVCGRVGVTAHVYLDVVVKVDW